MGVIHLAETAAKGKQRPEPLPLQDHRSHDWFRRDCGNGSTLGVFLICAQIAYPVTDCVLAGFPVLLLLCYRCGQDVSAPRFSVITMLMK
jgi:hypothetical protein